MRVLVVAPPYLPVPPDGYGGTEMVIDDLCRGLRDAGDEVLLVASGDSTCPVPTSWRHPRAVGVGQGGADAEVVQAAHAYRVAEEWEPDVVHDHTVVGPLLGSVRCVAPIITTNHGPFATPEASYRYRALDPRVTVVAISRHQASTAPTGVRVDAVIQHGIDVDALVPGDGGGGFALFLGRMHPTKGVDRALRIAHLAGMPLVLAAKMRERDEVRYFEEEVQPLLGPDDDVVGEVGGPRKQDLLRRATVLLNPLRWHEPFGLVMIEALAVGTPVVATPNGAVPEIVDDGETGFVCSGDEELAAALGRAASLDRATCREVARKRFGRDRMVAQHRQLYRRVADRRPEVTAR